MELAQALDQATETKRSRTYCIRGTPESVAAHLDWMEARHGNKLMTELVKEGIDNVSGMRLPRL